ncbi:hypothetical protein NMG60_11005109 [Bertholletia excelsa]
MITTLQIVEVKVRLHCKACENTVRRSLSKMKGVTCVEIDVISNKIRVMGYVDRKAVVKAIWKTGRKAELCQTWPSSPSCHREESRPRRHGCSCIIPKCVL